MSATDATPRSGRLARGRLAIAAALLALAIAVAVGSLSLGLWTRLGPGPGFFPLVIAVLLAGGAVAWALEQRHEVEPEEVEEGERANSPRRILAIVASLLLAAVAFEILGFQLTAALFLLFHLRVLARVRWLVAIPVVLVGSFGVFGLFDLVLHVPLPTSGIPFLAAIGL
jgi:putative tricarboxylic transport membrane protein